MKKKRCMKVVRAKRNYELAQGNSYESRQKYLEELGFSSYADYRLSDLWKEVRAKVFKQFGNQCQLCGEPATEAHHNRYHKNDLIGKRIKFIKPLCRRCHQSIEFDDRGFKRPVDRVHKEFKLLRRARKREVERVNP